MDCMKIESGSSSCQTKWKYDVFLSFRGEDTRNNFIDHLFGALQRKNIVTFKDDVTLKKGESISSELEQAIHGSQILIVVFSKNYASSTWCLQELSMIADYAEVPGRRVLPIFYDVDPSEVKKQNGNFGRAFEEHEERFKENSKVVQRWREALTKVANLGGFDVRDKPQYIEIEKIIKEVARLLGHKLLSLPTDIVGIRSGLDELEKHLVLDSDDDVRVVGICGMGGIGKTTLATVLYNRISKQFEASCFIHDVGKIYGDHGPIGAQKELIVLDNIGQAKQLEILAMNREFLGSGSRIIIISRDEHILRAHDVDAVYRVQLLRYDHALKLFCRKAFKCDDIIQGYSNLTHEALRYANGLPLAITVLGSFLCGRSVSEWNSALARLRENPRTDIMDVLRNSYNALDDMEKEIFLDIACFDSNETMEFMRNILNIREFHPDIGLRILIEKSLITHDNGFICMHNLLRKLGRTIIKENYPKEPRMWSRLWNYKDVFKVMLANKEAENVELIILAANYVTAKKTLTSIDALSKMSNLKVLIFKFLISSLNLSVSNELEHLSNELGYLCWELYPFTCLPSSFDPDKLVELILPYSSIKQLWEGTKHLPCLRTLILVHSKNLVEMPNFGCFPNLGVLDLEGCIKLVQIDASIGILKKLVRLNLKNCKSLVSIPESIFSLRSLEQLCFRGCSKLCIDPLEAKYLEEVKINESAIQSKSTFSIYKNVIPPFEFFYSRRRGDSPGSMLPIFPRFPCFALQRLDLGFCNIHQIPYAIGEIHCLEELYLGGNKFDKLPSSIKQLCRLRVLNLEHCKELKHLPDLPSTTVCPARRSGNYFNRSDTGIYAFDCPNLSEIDHNYSMAFSWMIHVFKILMQPCDSFDRIEVVIPGCEIPRWFNIPNEGTPRNMDLSPVLRDSNCMALACCATFVAHRYEKNTMYRGVLVPINKHPLFLFSSYNKGPMFEIPINVEKNLVTFDSDQLLILVFPRQRFVDYYVRGLNLHDITLETEASFYPDIGLPLKVKKFGYRCIFKEDLQQLNPQLMLSENVSVRKRKFLPTD